MHQVLSEQVMQETQATDQGNAERLIERLAPTGWLDVVDVAEVQLANLKAKLKNTSRIGLHHQDSTDLRFADAPLRYPALRNGRH